MVQHAASAVASPTSGDSLPVAQHSTSANPCIPPEGQTVSPPGSLIKDVPDGASQVGRRVLNLLNKTQRDSTEARAQTDNARFELGQTREGKATEFELAVARAEERIMTRVQEVLATMSNQAAVDRAEIAALNRALAEAAGKQAQSDTTLAEVSHALNALSDEVQKLQYHTVASPDIDAAANNGKEDDKADVKTEGKDEGKAGSADADLYLTIKIVTDESFQQHEGLGIADFDDPNAPLGRFRALKTESLLSFKKRVAQEFGYSIEQFRLWKLGRAGERNSSGVMEPIEATHPGQNLAQIHQNVADVSPELRLYLDFNAHAGRLAEMHTGFARTILVFVKYFDVPNQRIRGVGKLLLSNDAAADGAALRQTLAVLLSDASKDWEGDMVMYRRIRLFHEDKRHSLNLLAPLITQIVIQGDVLCAQVSVDKEYGAVLEANRVVITAPAFYDALSRCTSA